MLGLDAMMYDVLLPYSILCERLQTSIVPIGHNVCRWISDTFKCLDIMILRDGAKFGEEFQKWESRVDVTENLAKQAS